MEEDEDEDEDDDMEVVTFRIGTDKKNTMSLSQVLVDEHFQQFETDVVELESDEESDDEHQLSEEESSNVMLAAVALDLDFETVFDYISKGKSDIIFEWHKRLFGRVAV